MDTVPKAGNPVQVTTRQHFHDASGTGAPGSPTAGAFARTSNAGTYYGALERLTEGV